jgi:hypothetical protein
MAVLRAGRSEVAMSVIRPGTARGVKAGDGFHPQRGGGVRKRTRNRVAAK